MLAVARRAARVRVAVVQTRSFVKAGDKVPINFQKGVQQDMCCVESLSSADNRKNGGVECNDAHAEGKDPVIRQDKEYPEWLKRMDVSAVC